MDFLLCSDSVKRLSRQDYQSSRYSKEGMLVLRSMPSLHGVTTSNAIDFIDRPSPMVQHTVFSACW